MKHTRLFTTLITILCFSFLLTPVYALQPYDETNLSAEIITSDGRVIDISEYVSFCEESSNQPMSILSESDMESVKYKVDIPYSVLMSWSGGTGYEPGSGTYGAFVAEIKAVFEKVDAPNSMGAMSTGKYVSSVIYKYSCPTYNVSVKEIEFWAVSTGYELFTGIPNRTQDTRSTKTNLTTAIMNDFETGMNTGFTEYIEITDDIITDIRATTYFTLALGSSDEVVVTVTANVF